MADQAEIQGRIDGLATLHRDLDASIKALQEVRPFDQIEIQRLKKRKLSIRDEIERLQSQLVPDIIA